MQRGAYTLWEHGTPPIEKSPLPSNSNPPDVSFLRSPKCSAALETQRKCVISHVVSVDQSISRYRDSLAGQSRAFVCLCGAKLNTPKKRKRESEGRGEKKEVACAYKTTFSHALKRLKS